MNEFEKYCRADVQATVNWNNFCKLADKAERLDPMPNGPWREFLLSQRYLLPYMLGTHHWVAVDTMLFTYALIGGEIGNENDVEWRYCYGSINEALEAMVDWFDAGFQGEPQGAIRASVPLSMFKPHFIFEDAE